MSTLFVNQAIEDITDRYVSVTDSILKILYNDDISRAKRIFTKILGLAIKRYDEYSPVCRQVKSYGTISLKSNFQDYLDGKITENQVILDPISVANMNLGSSWMTKNQYSFDYKSGTIFDASGLVTYYASHPYIIRDGDNNNWEFSSDSAVYFLQDVESFENRLAYECLLHFTRTRNLIQLPTGIGMLDFTSTLQELNEHILTDEHFAPEMFDMWTNQVGPESGMGINQFHHTYNGN